MYLLNNHLWKAQGQVCALGRKKITLFINFDSLLTMNKNTTPAWEKGLKQIFFNQREK